MPTAPTKPARYLAKPDEPRDLHAATDTPLRALRFVRSLALGALVVGAPLSGCGGSTPSADGGPPDTGWVVDGPLHPPDLRRRRA